MPSSAVIRLDFGAAVGWAVFVDQNICSQGYEAARTVLGAHCQT